MRDKDLYAQILGIKSPWQVSGVELALSEGEVRDPVEHYENLFTLLAYLEHIQSSLLVGGGGGVGGRHATRTATCPLLPQLFF